MASIFCWVKLGCPLVATDFLMCPWWVRGVCVQIPHAEWSVQSDFWIFCLSLPLDCAEEASETVTGLRLVPGHTVS
jgi:hypothetical protein